MHLEASKKQKKNLFFSRGDSLGSLVVNFPKKYFKTFPGPMKSYIVKENHIGSAVRKILWYKQTYRHPLLGTY